MKRLWKAAFLGLVLAFAAGCPTPGHKASSGSSHAKAPAPPAPVEAPAAR